MRRAIDADTLLGDRWDDPPTGATPALPKHWSLPLQRTACLAAGVVGRCHWSHFRPLADWRADRGIQLNLQTRCNDPVK